MVRVSLFLLTCFWVFAFAPSLSAEAKDTYFRQAEEFPNLFLPAEFRDVAEDKVPLKVVEDQEKLLSDAVGSILSRIMLPISKNKKDIEQVRYFHYLAGELKKVDAGARVFASGGVVRSVLGYIYEEMHKRAKLDPNFDSAKFLRSLAADTVNIPAIRVRGVGSDFDIMIDGKASAMKRLIDRSLEITNSAEEASWKKTRVNEQHKKALFTFGDAKSYTEQTTRSYRQGGSSVDLLAFEVSKGHFVQPEGAPNFLRDLIHGTFRYLPPQSGTAEDAEKQTVRGIRPFLELPFLKLKEPKQFLDELTQLRDSLKAGNKISEKALEQFPKMVRNARFEGAHNRFYRGEAGSIEVLVQEITTLLGRKRENPLLPEFTDRFPIPVNGRESEVIPANLLMPVRDFMQKHTENGVLYHGTPDPENALAIQRQGLFLSSRDQGTAVYGRGLYSSPHLSVASGYARKNGMMFRLEVEEKKPLRILDWEKVKDDPAIQRIAKEAADQGKDVFELLARQHGIDIIVNEHVLIQNLEAVRMPNPSLAQVARTWLLKARDTSLELQKRLDALKDFEEIAHLVRATGEDIAAEEAGAVTVKTIFHESLSSADNRVAQDARNEALTLIKRRYPNNKEEITTFREYFFDPKIKEGYNLDQVAKFLFYSTVTETEHLHDSYPVRVDERTWWFVISRALKSEKLNLDADLLTALMRLPHADASHTSFDLLTAALPFREQLPNVDAFAEKAMRKFLASMWYNRQYISALAPYMNRMPPELQQRFVKDADSLMNMERHSYKEKDRTHWQDHDRKKFREHLRFLESTNKALATHLFLPPTEPSLDWMRMKLITTCSYCLPLILAAYEKNPELMQNRELTSALLRHATEGRRIEGDVFAFLKKVFALPGGEGYPEEFELFRKRASVFQKARLQFFKPGRGPSVVSKLSDACRERLTAIGRLGRKTP